MDPEFAADLKEIIDSRKPWNPPHGVILDSSILIAARGPRKRRRGSGARRGRVREDRRRALAVTAVELTHGIYRARTDADRKRRETFVEELFQAVAVHPLTLEVARLAGRIHGEQMGQGVSIDFPDLLIGATACIWASMSSRST